MRLKSQSELEGKIKKSNSRFLIVISNAEKIIEFEDNHVVPAYIKFLSSLSKNLCIVFISEKWNMLKRFNSKYLKLKQLEFRPFTRLEAAEYLIFKGRNKDFSTFFKLNKHLDDLKAMVKSELFK